MSIPMDYPTPMQIRLSRKKLHLTQKQAAEIVFAGSYRTWQEWEAGRRKMPAGIWRLWKMHIGEMADLQQKNSLVDGV